MGVIERQRSKILRSHTSSVNKELKKKLFCFIGFWPVWKWLWPICTDCDGLWTDWVTGVGERCVDGLGDWGWWEVCGRIVMGLMRGCVDGLWWVGERFCGWTVMGWWQTGLEMVVSGLGDGVSERCVEPSLIRCWGPLAPGCCRCWRSRWTPCCAPRRFPT